MLHIPDKEGFVGTQVVIGQDRMDGLALIDDSGVEMVEVVFDPQTLGLMKEIFLDDAT